MSIVLTPSPIFWDSSLQQILSIRIRVNGDSKSIFQFKDLSRILTESCTNLISISDQICNHITSIYLPAPFIGILDKGAAYRNVTKHIKLDGDTSLGENEKQDLAQKGCQFDNLTNPYLNIRESYFKT